MKHQEGRDSQGHEKTSVREIIFDLDVVIFFRQGRERIFPEKGNHACLFQGSEQFCYKILTEVLTCGAQGVEG
jgi:hypothetical protein